MNRIAPVTILPALLLWPLMASAAAIDIRSKHQDDVMVDGDLRSYYRVFSGKPLGFVLEGPEELSLTLRQDFGAKDKAGELETELMIFQDGYRIRRMTLKQPDGGMYLTGGDYSPSEAKPLKIMVPGGKHAYRFELVSKDQSITLSVMLASEDLESMMVVALVDDEPAPKPTDPGLAPVPWEESGGDPTPGALPPPPVIAPPPLAPAGPRRRHLLLGLRVLTAASGVGAPALGGGVHAMWRTGLLGDGLSLGLAVDLVPASAEGLSAGGEPRRLDWRGLLFGAAVRLQSPSLRGLRWQAQASAGGALLWASTEARSASSIAPAFGLSFGPSFELGPGSVTLEAQTSILLGEPEDGAGPLSASSLLGGLGLTLGYQMTL